MKLTMADITPNRLHFNSHTEHNPEYDILELKISRDSFITYTLNLNTKEESLEYYAGENYVVGSTLKSTSRHYQQPVIPKKYRKVWSALKEHYKKHYSAQF